jgi:hypothetical protein
MSDGQFKQYYGAAFVEALRQDRSAIFTEDTWRSLLLVLAVGGLIFAYIKQKLTQNKTLIILGLLVVFDLVGVDRRYVNADNFVSAIKVDRPYQANSIDNELLKDTSIFRVLDRSDNSTKSSYFHNSIEGYHAAKLRRFKELQDFHIDKTNFEVLNMLNTKYVIYEDKEGNLQYFENENANGNAWFIDAIETFESANDEILALDTINTKLTATANSKTLNARRFTKDSSASIKLVDYKLNHLVYKTTNAEDGFAVFSEVYYEKGWQAKIDGIEVKHFNVNYVLRGLKIPKGEHTVEFIFNPSVVRVGSTIALASSILLVVLILGQGLIIYRKRS